MSSEPSNRLKSVRREKGIAQAGVAARAHVSPAMVCAVERWDYRPSQGVQVRIAEALGVSVGEIWPAAGETA